MATITSVEIENYRSIGSAMRLTLPEGHPLVLLGENNTGKSNAVKALQLILGPFWPGNHEPEDHEFYQRKRENSIHIAVNFNADDKLGNRFTRITWDWMEDKPEFRGIFSSGATGYIRNEDRDTCICIIMEAERNLRYHLSYASKWTYLSRLMHRFHKSLLSQPDVMGSLESLFKQTKEEFFRIPEFAEFKLQLQNQLADLVSTMTHRLDIDFEAYNPTNFFRALELHALEGGQPRTLEEMGTGEQQILAMSFAYAYARAFHGGIVLVIEEPEAHLHPLAQSWLAARLRNMAREGLQVIITTHSPTFVNLLGLEGMVLLRKREGATQATQVSREKLVAHCIATGVPKGKVTEAGILPFYQANATTEIIEGFFAKLVVLVEGQSEKLALPIYLSRSGLEADKEGIAIVPVLGKGNLAKWHRMFSLFGIPTYLTFDNDSANDSDAE